MVSADFQAGTAIVEALGKTNLRVNVALWLFSPEHEDWRFVLASPKLDHESPADAYGLVHDALASAGIGLDKTPALLILKMADPFIRALRKIFKKTESVEGMRLGGQMIGDRFVSDAIVYRIR